ncbi:MAG TPA: hypothetical protein DCG47_09715 [Spirochaetaceae bacterium]|jgi:uncharacterized membrane protein YbjE (DUF340 family)|nr:hypothetical protein [Spirochaetaceae bacterium]
MDAFLQILVLVAFLAAGALFHRFRLSTPPALTDRIIKLVLFALLFVMGFRLGNARELFSRLGEIGLLAAATASFAVAGTIIAIFLSYAALDALRLRLNGRNARSAAVYGEARGEKEVAAAAADAAALSGLPFATSAPGWKHFKGPLVLLAFVVVGTALGAILPEYGSIDYGSVTGWVLNALLFMVGMQFAQSGLSLTSAFARADTALVPAATVAGSLLGGLAVAALFGINAGKGLALAAGFGWYSLSGVLIADLGDPALGSAAFLANLLREALALLLIPLLGASKRPYSAIGVGGATAMDVTLPLIEQCAGPAAVPISFASGAILSLLVPILVPLLYNLPF